MATQMQGVITETLVSIILAMIVLIGSYATYYIKKAVNKVKLETKRIQDQEQRKLLTDALEDLEDLTTKTVADIEQTTAKALREAVKKGIKERAELEALAKVAYNEIAEAFKPESKALIQKHFGSFSKYLTKAIESKVLELKSGN